VYSSIADTGYFTSLHCSLSYRPLHIVIKWSGLLILTNLAQVQVQVQVKVMAQVVDSLTASPFHSITLHPYRSFATSQHASSSLLEPISDQALRHS
jgi:hypothetical protein